MKKILCVLRQHRTITSADLSGSFAPVLQFQKRKIHTVFPRFRNFELAQNLSLRFLAELCGVALTLLSLMASFGACTFSQADTVSFYYPRADFVYDEPDGVIASEERDAAGHTADMQYLLSLYLMGPLKQELVSAFPKSTRLLSGSINDSRMLIELSDTSESLTDAEFSLGCACLALTCIKASGAEEIVITSGSRTLAIREDTLLLYEEPFPTAAETEETK